MAEEIDADKWVWWTEIEDIGCMWGYREKDIHLSCLVGLHGYIFYIFLVRLNPSIPKQDVCVVFYNRWRIESREMGWSNASSLNPQAGPVASIHKA